MLTFDVQILRNNCFENYKNKRQLYELTILLNLLTISIHILYHLSICYFRFVFIFWQTPLFHQNFRV